MKLLKILKYMFSVIILAVVTFAVLYLPGVYFRHYQYEIVIEDLEQHSYKGLDQNSVNFWQIYQMIKNKKYIVLESYEWTSENEKLSLEKNAFYLDMVEGVFRKYLRVMEKKDEILEKDAMFINKKQVDEPIFENIIFRNYIEDWLLSKKEWQVTYVDLFNLTEIIDSKIVNVQLYSVVLEIENMGIFINILFNPDTEIFYDISVCDERYSLEMTDIDEVYKELYVYYCKNGDDEYEMSRDECEKLMGIINVEVIEKRILEIRIFQ